MNPVYLSLLSGLLWGLSFPPFNAAPLAWFCLIPLLLLDDANGPFRRPGINRFLWAWFAGFVANLLIFFWVWGTFKAAGIGFWVTLNCWIALALILGSYPAFFLFLFGFLPKNIVRPFVGGLLWVFFDVVKTHVLTGFPWALLCHTQIEFLALVQVASFASAHAVTFLLVAVNIAGASALGIWIESYFSKDRRILIRIAKNFWILPVLGGVLLWGTRQLSRPRWTGGPVRVAILQGNIDQYQKWDASYETRIKNRYGTLVAEAAEKGADLIVWPESAVPGWIPNDEAMMEWLTGVIRKSGAHHIVGAVSRRDGKEYNSAFFFGPDGKMLGAYNKRHLVPFGEYIPFGGFLKRWVPYLGELGTFDAGQRGETFLLPLKGRDAMVRIEPNICYEAIFPFQTKADLIVNLTNDAWYLKTGAPAQHYAANVFRAVENKAPVIRAANTGISAIIDTNGRELIRSNLMETAVLDEVVYSSSGSDHL